MRVPTLKCKYQQENTEYYTSRNSRGGGTPTHKMSYPLAIYKKNGKITGLSLHILLQNLSYTELSSQASGNYPPMYFGTVTDQRMVKHNRSCKRNKECHFLCLNYNTTNIASGVFRCTK